MRAVLGPENAVRVKSKAVICFAPKKPREIGHFVCQSIRYGVDGDQTRGFGEEPPILDGVHCGTRTRGRELAIVNVMNAPLSAGRGASRTLTAGQ